MKPRAVALVTSLLAATVVPPIAGRAQEIDFSKINNLSPCRVASFASAHLQKLSSMTENGTSSY
jgi:hypothetical protein